MHPPPDSIIVYNESSAEMNFRVSGSNGVRTRINSGSIRGKPSGWSVESFLLFERSGRDFSSSAGSLYPLMLVLVQHEFLP